MAKSNKDLVFKNATINKENMIITEIDKEEVREYSLSKVLEEWDGIEGITVSFRYNEDIPTENF